jgi:hypothetical protein
MTLDGRRFCSACGALDGPVRADAERERCVDCEAVVDVRWAFCPACGNITHSEAYRRGLTHVIPRREQ